MCRLFGFRSVIQSQVHSSLVSADNALMNQSVDHPDGWGVAYYIGESPHVVKSIDAAVEDHLFQRVSGIVASETVVAHLRKATLGEPTILNTHPFQYGKWVFAHNGNIRDFSQHEKILRSKIEPSLQRFILGDTDSELLFYLLLTELGRNADLHRSAVSVNELISAAKKAMAEVTSVIGPFARVDGDPSDTYLSFIVTNGSTLLAHQGGKSLHYSTYKSRCPDRDVCSSFAPECEAPTQTGSVNHLVLSSEPLQGENIWLPLGLGEMIGVDWRMQLMKA